MKDCKYTSDGKKVVIVGKLNAQETIVQEIFVSGGSEIPSGEHFVVKSLHDAPAESWKEKNLRELEERYDRRKKELESREKEATRRLTLATTKANEKATCLMAFANNSNDPQLDLLRAFLAGEITHFAILGYDPNIVAADDNCSFQIDNHYSEMRVEAMKLISVYGSSNGKLDYRLHDYRDGSGGSKAIIPCRSYAEALGHLQKNCDEYIESYKSNNSPNRSSDFARWMKIEGIVIPDEVIRMSNADKAKALAAKIAKAKEELEKEEATLAALTAPTT
jgi:hypothetical protein